MPVNTWGSPLESRTGTPGQGDAKNINLSWNLMEEYKSPVYNVIAVPIDKVVANILQPERGGTPEMKLLNYPSGKTATRCPAFVTTSRKRIFMNSWTVFTATKS